MRAERLAGTLLPIGRIRRILVIVNPQAGGVLRDPGLPAVLRRLVGTRGEAIVTRCSEDVTSAVSRARLQDADTIAMCGGDGTARLVLSAIDHVYRGAPWPRLAVLCGGTLNTVARNLGCYQPAPKLLAALLAAERPFVQPRPLIRVNEHTGFIFGAQTVARVLGAYYEQGASPSSAVLLAARIVAGSALRTRFLKDLFAPERTELSIDGGEPEPFLFTGLLAATVAVPAVGLRVLHRACEEGGFHLIGTESPPSKIVPEAGRLWVGLPVSVMSVDRVAHRAVMTFQEPARFTVDGDLFSSRRIELSATPPVELMMNPRLGSVP
jgi:hypothetical protein